MTKKKKSSGISLARRIQRKLAMAQGFYDGRFRTKKIVDKKKEASRKKSRNKPDLRKNDWE